MIEIDGAKPNARGDQLPQRKAQTAMRVVWPVVATFALVAGLVLLAGQVLPGLHDAVNTAPGHFGRKLAAMPWPERIPFVVGLLIGLFMLPAILVQYVGGELLGIKALAGNPYAEDLGAWSFVLVVVTFWLSWVFWSFVVSRWLRFLGLWNPFLGATRGRRRFLQGWIRFRQWLEFFRFGRGPVAAFAGFWEVLSCRFLEGDVFLGRPQTRWLTLLRPVGISTEKHMVTIAGTGAGKSTSALIPNLCLHRGSLLCVDPKGELAMITAARRGPGHWNGRGRGVKGLGQRVYVLDPFKIVKGWESASYNVFDEMARVAAADPDRPVSYAGKIAEALVTRMSEKESYWDNAAQTFLRGLILYVFTKVPEESRSLATLRWLVMQGELHLYGVQVEAGTIDPEGPLTPFDVLLEAMKLCRGGPYGEVISAAASSLLMMGPNQMGSVITTAQEHTSFLDSPELQKIGYRSDFLLEDLKNDAISVFLCLPLNMVSGKEGRWLRMFVLLTVDMMMRVTTAPKPPILLAVDEFPSLGHLDGIEVVAPVLRSYGVRFWVVGQDIEQFERAYPKSWGGFIGNAEAVQFLGNTHPETVDLLVKLLGEHVVSERVNDGQRTRRVQTIKPLLDRDQAARLLAREWGNQIVWRGSKRPLLLKTAPYFDYLPYWYSDADPRFKEPWKRSLWRAIG